MKAILFFVLSVFILHVSRIASHVSPFCRVSGSFRGVDCLSSRSFTNEECLSRNCCITRNNFRRRCIEREDSLGISYYNGRGRLPKPTFSPRIKFLAFGGVPRYPGSSIIKTCFANSPNRQPCKSTDENQNFLQCIANSCCWGPQGCYHALFYVVHLRRDCEPGFKNPPKCEDINECASNPCFNNGVCKNGPNKFTCECPVGTSGDRCEQVSPTTSTVDLPSTESVTEETTFVSETSWVSNAGLTESATEESTIESETTSATNIASTETETTSATDIASTESTTKDKIIDCSQRTNSSDMIFVLDESGSINAIEFDQQLTWVIELLRRFRDDIDSGSMRVGIIMFNTEYRIVINLITNTFDSLSSNIRLIIKQSGGSRLGNAMSGAIEEFVSRRRQFSAMVMVVFTDGESTDAVGDAALNAKCMCITTISVGIGSDVNSTTLLMIANNDPNHVFELSDFNSLTGITSAVQEIVEEPNTNSPAGSP